MAYGFHLGLGQAARAASPHVRRIAPGDCLAALAEGFDDFVSMPTYPAFVGLFYALSGIAIVSLSSIEGALRLVFPLVAGFALVGPFFAVGLYEMSRGRELGLKANWRTSLSVARSPALPSIFALGLILFAVFVAWIHSAETLYVRLYGPDPPTEAVAFLRDVLTTSRGFLLMGLGGLVGFCFAALSLSISVVSFPLMLDRNIGLIAALATSLRVATENPCAVAFWGLIVAVGLVLGSLPVLFGLAVVMPILGHATWHFYRRAVGQDPGRGPLL